MSRYILVAIYTLCRATARMCRPARLTLSARSAIISLLLSERTVARRADDRAFISSRGLILGGGQHTLVRDGYLVWSVIAQDETAVDQPQMSYDAKKSLEGLLKRCDGLPLVVPAERCLTPSHCDCRHPSYFCLQSPAEGDGSPVMCGDCRRSYPLYRTIRNPAEREFDLILSWQTMRRGYIEQYTSGLETAVSRAQLSDCVSDLSLTGRRLAGEIERETGITTFYPLYSYYETPPVKCPQCGGDWVNHYRDAVPFERCCRECRLVM